MASLWMAGSRRLWILQRNEDDDADDDDDDENDKRDMIRGLDHANMMREKG